MLGQEGLLAGTERTPEPPRPHADLNGGLHHRAKARRVIQLFMNGGVSQMDTFDFKPELDRRHGQKFDPGGHVEAPTSSPGKLMQSPFPFKQYGECGRWVSSVFPELATCVDDLAFLMALSSKTNVHGPASFMMNTGFLMPGFPCMGAWLSYGLGSLCDNLPTFVVLARSAGAALQRQGQFHGGFLAPVAPGGDPRRRRAAADPRIVSARRRPASSRPRASATAGRCSSELNRRHAAQNEGDSRLESRIAAYELAARMQRSAPEALDLAGETPATRALYGLDDPATADYGRRCLLARRLLERGVRFVQVWSGAGGADQQLGQPQRHPQPVAADGPERRPADRGVAARPEGPRPDGRHARRLQHRVRPPAVHAGSHRPRPQRRHVVAWLAGAGVKGGAAHGESDPWAWRAAAGQTYCYDLHATILHLMGIDHTRLTFRHNGIDRRLTDVHGHVVDAILA